MSSTADTDDVIEVSADGLSVRKTFTADEFPVPAIRFEIESEHDEQVAFRLSEDIPESFPMDKVGFHPDYHSDDWTAFQDNHVEFIGSLEPDDRFVTVYGVRIDDESDAEQFLTEPEIVEVSSEGERGSDAEALDDDVINNIVSDDGNQAVKDMIAGDSESVPGLENEDADDTGDDEGVQSSTDRDDLEAESDGLDLDLGDVDTEPEPIDDEPEEEDDTPDIDLGFGEDEIPEPDDSVGDDESEGTELEIDLGDDEDDDGVDSDDTDALEEADDAGDEPEIELDLEAGTAATDEDDTSADDEPSADEDLEAAGTETESEPVGETETAETAETAETETGEDAEIGEADDPSAADDEAGESAATTFDGSVAARLATELREDEIDEADLEALRSELDLEPSGPDIAKLEHLQSRVEEVTAYTDALEQFLEENGTGKQLLEEVQTDLESIEDDMAAMDDRVDESEDRLEDVETDLETVTTDVDAVETDLDAVAADVTTVEDDVGAVTDDVSAVEESVEDLADDVTDLEEDVETVEADLEDVRADVTDIQEWRNQLGSMFSD